jgi:hypothetical protein
MKAQWSGQIPNGGTVVMRNTIHEFRKRMMLSGQKEDDAVWSERG